jgi:hypothetical protein
MAQFRQPDFTKGDPNTIGGYAAAHERPAAFEGSDGFSYSVEILTEPDRDQWSGYLFFVKWSRIGASSPEGHLESEELRRGATEAEVRERVGAMALTDVKRVLDELIASAPGGTPKRKWWDAMNDDPSPEHHE